MGVKRDALDWPLNMIEYEKRESTLIYSEQTAQRRVKAWWRGGKVQVEGSPRLSGSQVDWLATGRIPTKAVKRAVVV